MQHALFDPAASQLLPFPSSHLTNLSQPKLHRSVVVKPNNNILVQDYTMHEESFW